MQTTPGSRPITVITGGSDGIGLELARLAAARGERVLLVARGTERLAAAAATIAGALTLALDITSPDACDRLDEALLAAGGHCEVLINAAGVGLAGDFVSHDPAAIDRLAQLNIAALTRLMRHVLPGMLGRRRGAILNLASLGGYAPGPYQAAYYASKAYVLSLTEAVAHECAGSGVRIAVAAPGPVRTEFHRRMGGQSGWYLRAMPVPSAAVTARRIDRRFRAGQRVIVPGVVPSLLMPVLRVLPHPIGNAIVGTLLRPRD